MLRQALGRLELPEVPVATVSGRLVGASGLLLESVGCPLETGQRCVIETTGGGWLQAQVVGFKREVSYLMPFKKPVGLTTGARVLPAADGGGLMIGPSWLGRIVNGLGEPLDGLGRLGGEQPLAAHPPQVNPLKKQPVSAPLDVGVRAINSLLTIGRGQRVGLFAGSGVGKSVLLGMITRHTEADVVVVGLIGERGREVREFVEHSLGEAGLAKAVLVVAPADESPLMRLKATELTHTIAAHFRDQGRNVLLLVDSLTRYAMAQREVALALGEPPATRGYPPSVFGLLPSLAESAGNGEGGAGSMSAIYTVLAEGDDQQDPVVDTARAILDGHIVLSRELAERGHYPAIDIGRSVSRCMSQLTEAEHAEAARGARGAWSRYQEVRSLIPLGGYVAGADADTDRAVRLMPRLEAFLRQGAAEAASYEDSRNGLMEMIAT
ncbi:MULTISPECIES: flagellar protein export ATPase FliI [Chromobacterium]|uniref:Flagellum-specific ATP synthase n=1 Tax=Chromobacterium haemolyticum TaxID=394935 RepID=A0A1W0D297_9NEIS|nr:MULTISPECIES: flagellar protein export ATPase FliI [Chromobacterium]MBK0413570.1 flagellar protein export ATPase FliI [Chromobacterium haemolyticum]MBO0414672.1 flagellar protein export ATPase FliI [Chromobacterium haemolyticum]MBO0497932.1 flagellar protein export ATPase FliI [Chromobacterium haemolyticum]MDH0343339.1 flagellar protein export ATPase FliI [Chromobacterium haemolyticum]OQS32913.1 flagellum-specific ATP synthase FliI [Chromobacterium haemolyticum]